MRFRFSKAKPSINRINLKVLTLLICTLLATTMSQPVASAPLMQVKQFETGDILVSASSGNILWYDRNGKFIQIIQPEFGQQAGGLAISPLDKNLYETNINGPNLAIFNQFGQLITDLTPGFDKGSFSLAFASNGTMYVGDITSYGHILRLDPFGKPVADFKVATDYISELGSILWFDLSLDQKTLYYSSAGQSIYRFDLTSGEQLKDFATLPPINTEFARVGALRLLYPGDGSGGLLVADTNDIKRLDAFGNVIQVYDDPKEDNWLFTLSLDPDGQSFWSSSGTRIYKFDIASGKPLLAFDAGANIPVFSQTNSIWGLTVVGEPLAAQPTSTPTSTYTPITPSPTSTPTPTLTPITSTLTPVLPTWTPVIPTLTPLLPTSSPYPIATSTPIPPRIEGGLLILFLIFLVLFVSALGIGGIVFLAQSIRSKPEPVVNTVSPPKVWVHGYDDIGEQTFELGSNLSLPKLHLRAGQGVINYTFEIHDQGGGSRE